MNSIIKLENIEKKFKNQIIFKNLDLNISEPKIIGFVGHNGSGKSVLFKLISGIYKPDKGNVFIRNQKLGKNNYDFAINTGLLVDSPGFIGLYNGFKNLKYLASINNLIDDNKIIDLMKELDLDPYSKTLTKNYSLGMKQKLGIIQAIMENQDIIILDEPFNGLDKESCLKVKNLIRQLRSENKTILLTSHYQIDLDELCEEIYSIEQYELKKVI